MHDTLQKPDMPAVLTRTKLSASLDNLLLPMFEAVSNGIHATQERFKNETSLKGAIAVSCDLSGGDAVFVVSDNGAGLTTENYQAFKTPFTGHKLRKNGKGFGRFVGFKVFERIHYDSRFGSAPEDGRKFDFNIYEDHEITETGTPRSKFGTEVRYAGIRDEFKTTLEQAEAEEIVSKTIRHFLPHFVGSNAPDIKICIDGTDFDLREHFVEFFQAGEATPINVQINDDTHNFDVRLAKVQKGHVFSNHALLMFAGDRVIGGGRNISGKLGSSYFKGPDDKKYVVVACVSGHYFDDRANQERTELVADAGDIDEVVQAVVTLIEDEEKDQITRIKSTQASTLRATLDNSPLLRIGLRGATIDEYVKRKPHSWSEDQFVQDLSLAKYRDVKGWHRDFEKYLSDPKKFAALKKDFLDKADQTKRDALAEYIVHRKAIIDIASQLRLINDEGKSPTEDQFHDLIFGRHSDSTSVSVKEHNLWMLDERLSFCSYISSDRTIHGGGRKSGDKITDILVYEEAMLLRGTDANTLMIVELKKPGRDDYKLGDPKKDPIEQVYQTVEHIRLHKQVRTKDGKYIDIPDGTNVYAYIVADIVPKLRGIAERNDFSNTWDKKGMYKYHDKYDVFIEIVGFDKLITDAKKRNAAFFDVLLDDPGV